MQEINNCNCCTGTSVETPVEVKNRPGLKAVSYRIGTHREFKESLLAKLSLSHKAALRSLTTRSNDDFTIALIDAWATVADVLTFYQERIVNESYLHTATERLSISELARLIGYELRPGVAANTYLAFTVDDTVLTPISGIVSGKEEIQTINIDKGIKVQSVPGQDEKPQIFETIETIEARPEWNAMQPRMTQPQVDVLDANSLYLKGTDYNLSKGNLILINDDEQKIKKIIEVVLDSENDTTRIIFNISNSTPENGPEVDSKSVWENEHGETLDKNVSATYSNNEWQQAELQAYFFLLRLNINYLAINMNLPKEPEQSTDKKGVFVFRRSVSVFGYNAPKQVTYETNGTPKKASEWEEWNLNEEDNKIYLDNVYEEIQKGSFIAVQKPNENLGLLNSNSIYKVTEANTRPRTEYGISAKTTEITIKPQKQWYDNLKNENSPEKVVADLTSIRSITIHAQSEALEIAEVPLSDIIDKDKKEITLSKFYPNLEKGKVVSVTAERHDLPGVIATEIKVIEEIRLINGYTKLIFDSSFNHPYFRKTLTINANVASATHGETVQEILGDGNAAQPFQKFTLKHKPLTYTTSDTPTGTATSLEIRVNDILWKEVSSLYDQQPDERIYITRQNDNEETTVIFGDGFTGARLPSGQQNIRATYRAGIGASGMLRANQLSQLMTRPLGVKEATNPQKPTGAQDREILEEARANANLTIYTLDRIVSLQDYEDFARAFAGIKKAKAIWAWDGREKRIHLTIAGVDGAVIDAGSLVYTNLINAIQKASIPGVNLIIRSYQPQRFRVKAYLKINPDYIADKVIEAAFSTLKSYYSFENRNFGQAVSLSEVSSILSKTEGVIYVDVETFYIDGQVQQRNDLLIANVSKPGIETPLPAELLTINLLPNDLIAV